MITRLAIAVALLVGCVSRGDFDQLPQQDQQRFSRCMHPMQPVLCGSDTDTVYVAMCLRGAEATYAEQHGQAARQEWLIGNGCPPPMVNPASYARATEPADKPMPRHSTASPAQAADEE